MSNMSGDEKYQDSLNEARALTLRINRAYSMQERSLAGIEIDADPRISRFLKKFNEAASEDLVYLRRSFVYLGFLLAADPEPEATTLSADVYFKKNTPQEMGVPPETYHDTVAALRQYAERLMRGEYKKIILQ